MRPETHDAVYINGELAVRLYPSVGRPGSRCDGYVMWSWDYRPLGWVSDGSYLIENVVAALLCNGDLTPAWQATPTGLRLIHRRYTLDVEQTSTGWVVHITDEVNHRCHSLTPKASEHEAVFAAEALLRKVLGRAMPTGTACWLPSDFHSKHVEVRTLLLALASMRDSAAELVLGEPLDAARSLSDREMLALRDLAKVLDNRFKYWWDPVPLLGTIIASHIKAALVKVYRGATEMIVDPTTPPIRFTDSELITFRERFRRWPLTDEEYLEFVRNRFMLYLRILRNKDRTRRFPSSPIASRNDYQPRLDPRKHRGDYPIRWPVEPGTRMFKAILRVSTS